MAKVAMVNKLIVFQKGIIFIIEGLMLIVIKRLKSETDIV